MTISSLVGFNFGCQCFTFIIDCFLHSPSFTIVGMKLVKTDKLNSSVRFLPSIDSLLKTATAKNLSAKIGAKRFTEIARSVIDELREDFINENLINNENDNFSREELLEIVEKKLVETAETFESRKFRRVVNATGVILHTNLGRAPLSEAARKAVLEAAGYCTLEYDLTTGKRGRRGRQAEELLCELTGAESALIVNNCAAAAFLVLSALSAGGEAIVSRGELVEIGGDFRVPDVMMQSGTKLVEVGTTNRTKLKDFADATTENTKLFVRVHPSNFRVIGFTAAPDLTALAALARERGVLLYEDAGSGAIVDLSEFGLNDEPVISESIKAGADVVTFSGDKLLGAVQAGIIVGKSEFIEKLRKHPLYRVLRVDKLAYAALAATLEIYQKEKHFAEIPVLRMLSQSKEEIAERAENFIKKLQADLSGFESQTFNLQLAEGASAVGGGSAPLTHPPTILISVRHDKLSAEKLESALRSANPPIIARIENDCLLLDLRTVSRLEEADLSAVLREIAAES